MYDVLVIGCGITGAAMAFELSKYHLKVGVLERENDIACGATKANSGILHAGYDPKPDTLMAKLNVRGTELGKQLCAALNVPFRICGSFVVAFSKEDEAMLDTLYHRGLANGVEGLELLSGTQARELEPSLSPEVTAALHAPGAAICSPWEYCLALAETAVTNGVELHTETAVTGLEQICGGWLVHTTQGDFSARWVVNAAGVDAQCIHEFAAPPSFTIRCVRGQYDLLDKSEGDRVSRVIFQCPNERGKGVLVAPTAHGNLLTGPSAEDVIGNDTSTASDVLARVRETAHKTAPSVDFRQTIRSFAGVRAVSDRGDFIIEEAAPGFMDLAGISSPGLSAAPAIAEYAAALMGKSGLTLELKNNFTYARRPVRFRELSLEEKTRLAAEHPSYGRVVCRCETVTEGEILDAIHSPVPPRSVDGVKRRAGAGLGRCQGGFCAPRVVELLARELGVSPGDIVQESAGSWLLSGQTKGGDAHV